jgi:hypothetical protein
MHQTRMASQDPKRNKLLRMIAGYSCIGLGVAGCILPIIPGLPLLFVGLGLLSVYSPWAARLQEKLKKFVASITKKPDLSQTKTKPQSDVAGYD